MIRFTPRLHPLEAREVPAAFVVNTALDLPDANLTDGQPLTATGKVSLRSVIEHYNVNPVVIPGGALEPCLIEFANVLFQTFQNEYGATIPPNAQTADTQMVVLLGAQLPPIPSGWDYVLAGSTTRRVTITRDPATIAPPTDAAPDVSFRFLEVLAGGKLRVNGLKITDADNRITAGTASGGAIYNSANGTLEVINCYFYNNKSDQGGAIANLGALTVSGLANSAEKTKFVHNTATAFGGAIYVGGNGVTLATNDIQDTLFDDNLGGTVVTRLSSGKGGAIASNASGLFYIANCVFQFNRAKEGGGIYADGALTPVESIQVKNSSFTGNTAGVPNAQAVGGGIGGAVRLSGLIAKITSCTFNDNKSDNIGGAISQEQGKLTLDACLVFAGNFAKGVNGSHDVANILPNLVVPLTVFKVNGTSVTVVRE